MRWLALGLLVGFGLLHSRLPEQDGSPKSQRLANLIVALQTGLVIVLIETTRAGFPFILLFLILSVTVMLYNPLRPGLLWLGGFILLTGWFFFEQEGLSGGLRAMAIYAGGYLFFGVVTNALTQARLTQRQNALLLGELQAKNRQLEEYAAQVETLAVVEERNRLAREMHDTIGHRLTTAAVQLEGAQRLAASEPERAAAMIGAGRQQVREALQDLRRTVGRLREPVEVELSLPQALQPPGRQFPGSDRPDDPPGAARECLRGYLFPAPGPLPHRAGGSDQRPAPCRRSPGLAAPGMLARPDSPAGDRRWPRLA